MIQQRGEVEPIQHKLKVLQIQTLMRSFASQTLARTRQKAAL